MIFVNPRTIRPQRGALTVWLKAAGSHFASRRIDAEDRWPETWREGEVGRLPIVPDMDGFQGLVAGPGIADVAGPCGNCAPGRAARAGLGIAQDQPVGRIAGAPLADRQRDRAPPGIDRHVGLGPGDQGFHRYRGAVREHLYFEGLAVAEKDRVDPLAGTKFDGGVHAQIDRRARQWLAEILYGLTTGNYRRVAEIHFEAQYVPSYHSVDEFATALRAVGEPMRGKPVSELSVGQMLDGLFAITRDFDMATQPHLLLLQKTMVMVEGLATSLDPTINMWDVSAPFVRAWIRDELGPEAALADRVKTDVETLLRVPELVRRIEDRFPARGGAPEPPPLPDIPLMWERRGERPRWPGYLLAAGAGGAAVGAAFLAGLV